MSRPADEVRAVTGWAGRLDVPRYEAPAVIVNPEASTAALLAWALGQTEQVNAVLEALATGSADDGLAVSTLAGAVQHFNEQVHAVLEAVRDRVAHAVPPAST